jgi:hypothetical protein
MCGYSDTTGAIQMLYQNSMFTETQNTATTGSEYRASRQRGGVSPSSHAQD